MPTLSVTTTGIQSLAIYVTLRVRTTNTCNFSFRVQDTTAANVTIYASDAMQITQTAIQTQISGFFFYTVPATGARTLRVQAGCTQAGACDVLAAVPVNGEAYNTPMIQAVILLNGTTTPTLPAPAVAVVEAAVRARARAVVTSWRQADAPPPH